MYSFVIYFLLFPLQSNRLHARYVGAILREAAIKLRTLPNLNTASTAISKQITICGDLHGKLDDLLVVFYKVSKNHVQKYFQNFKNNFILLSF